MRFSLITVIAVAGLSLAMPTVDIEERQTSQSQSAFAASCKNDKNTITCCDLSKATSSSPGSGLLGLNLNAQLCQNPINIIPIIGAILQTICLPGFAATCCNKQATNPTTATQSGSLIPINIQNNGDILSCLALGL